MIMKKISEIILNLDQWFRRCCLKILSRALEAHFHQRSKTKCAIMLEGILTFKRYILSRALVAAKPFVKFW